MFRSLTTSICVAALSVWPSIASAHEGHGHTPDQGNTLFHYLTEPIHLLQLVAVAAVAAILVRLLIVRSTSNPSFK